MVREFSVQDSARILLLEEFLNEVGKDGWELVSVAGSPTENTTHLVYLKRGQSCIRPRQRSRSADEMGYLPLDDLGATIFFQLVSARYERGSIILTSNKSFGDWGTIFGDPIIATAILDRLLHHSTTINIRGESYRLKDRRKAGLFTRAEEGQADRPAPFPSPEISQNSPRRQGFTSSRKTSAALTAPGRSDNTVPL